MNLEKIVSEFLKKHADPEKKLLLALSGGPDSIALFHLLLRSGFSFEVAHVNHRWRKESDTEASLLREMTARYSISFHEKVLVTTFNNNLEERGRNERLEFFKELLSLGFQALLLAHHADDHAETVLKRVFEGATLPALKGLVPVSSIDGMTLFRPLLECRKADLLEWLAEEKISYFLDPTNKDPRFLRSRMREELFPSLSKSFGKEVVPSLVRLGKAAEELNLFLEELLAPYRKKIKRGEGGIEIDFEELPTANFELKAVLRDFFMQERISLTANTLDSLLFHLRKGKGRRELKIGKKRVIIDKKRVLVIPQNGV